MRENIVVRRAAAAALLAVAGIVLVACGASESDETTAPSTSEEVRSYVGTVEGTDAFVSVTRPLTCGFVGVGEPCVKSARTKWVRQVTNYRFVSLPSGGGS